MENRINYLNHGKRFDVVQEQRDIEAEFEGILKFSKIIGKREADVLTVVMYDLYIARETGFDRPPIAVIGLDVLEECGLVVEAKVPVK